RPRRRLREERRPRGGRAGARAAAPRDPPARRGGPGRRGRWRERARAGMTERPLSPWIDHLRGRLPIALGVALLGAVARLATPPPPARTADAIAGMLG